TNNLLRGPMPGSMPLIAQDTANLPGPLSNSIHQLVLDRMQDDDAFEWVVRDGKNGFPFFNIEGHHYDYDAATNSFRISDGRLLIAPAFANELGLSAEARVVGNISITATVQPVEIRTIVNGELQSVELPPVRPTSSQNAPDAPELVSGP